MDTNNIPSGDMDFEINGKPKLYPIIQHTNPSPQYHTDTAIENGGYMMLPEWKSIKAPTGTAFNKLEEIKHFGGKSSKMLTCGTQFEAVVLAWSKRFSMIRVSGPDKVSGEIKEYIHRVDGFISQNIAPKGVKVDWLGYGFDLYVWMNGETETNDLGPIIRKVVFKNYASQEAVEQIANAKNERLKFLEGIGEGSDSKLAPLYSVMATIGLQTRRTESRSKTPYLATYPKIDIFDGNKTPNFLSPNYFKVAQRLYMSLVEENKVALLSGVKPISGMQLLLSKPDTSEQSEEPMDYVDGDDVI